MSKTSLARRCSDELMNIKHTSSRGREKKAPAPQHKLRRAANIAASVTRGGACNVYKTFFGPELESERRNDMVNERKKNFYFSLSFGRLRAIIIFSWLALPPRANLCSALLEIG